MRGAPPLITEIARPWWDALARHEIALQRCDDCAAWIFYPRPFCTACGGRSLGWAPVEPAATLYTWSVADVPVSPAFAHLDAPILAVAELFPGVRVPTSLVGVERGAVQIGMALAPVFDDATYEGVTLLRFRPAGDGKEEA
jgi:uncharacterized protein